MKSIDKKNTILSNSMWNVSEEELDNCSCWEEIYDIYMLIQDFGKQYVGNKVRDIELEKAFNKEEVEWELSEQHVSHFDGVFKLCEIIRKENIKSFLNLGTGIGGSVAAAAHAMKSGLLITVDHISFFNIVAKENLDFIANKGFYDPNKIQIKYIDANLTKFKKRVKLFDKNFRIKYAKFIKIGLLTYDINFSKQFDAVFVDGPPCFRLPTLSLAVDAVRDGGLLLLEYGRKPVEFLKCSQKFNLKDYGRAMVKLVGRRKYKVRALSWLVVDEKVRDLLGGQEK